MSVNGAVYSSISLLILSLVALSIASNWVLNSPTIILNLFLLSSLLDFTPCILKHCCVLHTHLGLLYLGGLILNYYVMLFLFLIMSFALKCTLCDINIVTPAFFSFMFAWYVFLRFLFPTCVVIFYIFGS